SIASNASRSRRRLLREVVYSPMRHSGSRTRPVRSPHRRSRNAETPTVRRMFARRTVGAAVCVLLGREARQPTEAAEDVTECTQKVSEAAQVHRTHFPLLSVCELRRSCTAALIGTHVIKT